MASMAVRKSRPGMLDAIQRLDAHAARWTRSRGNVSVFLHELFCFGVKQASACLFGGCMVSLMWLTWALYPRDAWLPRYDFLTLSALSIQCLLLAARLESRDEAKVILMFHGVGTMMEIFKTSVGSWTYPETSFLHIAGVPLFSGFMYASVGSYIARAWRLFDFRFTHHPSLTPMLWLALAIYANFFTHHFLPDARAILFVAVAALFGRTWVFFRIRHVYRRMPLLVGFALVATFIWLAENIGTFTSAWRYPAQRHAWSMVPLSKLGAWFLLMIISYAMVSCVAMRRDREMAFSSR